MTQPLEDEATGPVHAGPGPGEPVQAGAVHSEPVHAGTASAASTAGLPAPGTTEPWAQVYAPYKDEGRKAKGRLLFAAGGLGLGLVAGLLLGQIEFPSATSSAIADAVESCGVSAEAGINVLDDGRSISMKTSGAESGGAEYADVVCVLDALKMPQSVVSRMGSTRALDGRQSGQWGGFSASWGYHPDNGLDIVVEAIDQK
jgi:hypothetical protein